MIGIYAIHNMVNGKCYVGQAVDVKNRVAGHFKRLRAGKHHCVHLQLAFHKYGQVAFAHSVLEECMKRSLTDREQYWMDYYRDRGIYNTAPAAGTNAGIRFSPETRAKMVAKLTGRPVSAESREKMAESRMGWKPSDETRAKMSAAKRNISPETKARMSAAHIGKKLPETTRANMSKARKGKPHCGHVLTLEDNANRAGCILTEEHKAKVSASLTGNKRRLGTVASPETRAKLSEKTKRYWESRKTLQHIERIG